MLNFTCGHNFGIILTAPAEKRSPAKAPQCGSNGKAVPKPKETAHAKPKTQPKPKVEAVPKPKETTRGKPKTQPKPKDTKETNPVTGETQNGEITHLLDLCLGLATSAPTMTPSLTAFWRGLILLFGIWMGGCAEFYILPLNVLPYVSVVCRSPPLTEWA